MTDAAGESTLRPHDAAEPERRPVETPWSQPRWDRRTFIKQGALSGAAALALGAGPAEAARRAHRRLRASRAPRPEQPNILTIVVDQLRTPVWMPPAWGPAQVMPNLAALLARSVNFTRHYTAANDCSPSRSVLLTGLYTHQTGVLITGAGHLDPRFPTWGRLLRELGYETVYYGKWHLNPDPNASLSQYGFAGGTYPSPNGSPGQGTLVDGSIAAQFVDWLDGRGEAEPWATTVSFVNPHDIAWWHRFTERIPAESSPPPRAVSLPGNYETPERLFEQAKPLLQRSLQDTAARSFGAVPFDGPETLAWWTNMMDTYLLLQSYVDAHVGRVLEALASRPEVAANTVVIFTSDHGEYAGSHGMRGKGASAYEEAIRVPLAVYDPRGVLTRDVQQPRAQLTSSADVAALMLTIAWGSAGWRAHQRYSHLAGRLDLAAICANAQAPGRSWVLHTTDEDVTEFASQLHAAEAPRHVVSLRSTQGKLTLYSNWQPGTTQAEAGGRESELYDYSSEEGQLELTSQERFDSPLEDELLQTLEESAVPDELNEPLPIALRAAQGDAFDRYFEFEEREALKVLRARRDESQEPTPEAL
ncbi:MAG TPA: sulfatase-like hydrolase/transferase [Solirubrobacteraceae bacterium]|jgi:arylsulfatase A-like enzyme|nr:sulfatase-like hydrolase/transferase [Solirubrobacteraceae bacterium]